MSSSQLGTGISSSKVKNIEALGFWVLVDEREYFIPFADYPIFRGASLEQIFKVEKLSSTQLHWPGFESPAFLGVEPALRTAFAKSFSDPRFPQIPPNPH